MVQRPEKTIWQALEQLELLPYDPAMHSWYIPEGQCLHKTCTQMLVTLFVLDKGGSNANVHLKM